MAQILLIIHVIITVSLIVIILLQKSESDGFGSGMGAGGNGIMSSRGVGNLITRTTAFLAAGFMITSLLLTFLSSQASKSSIVENIEKQQSIQLENKIDEKEIVPSVPIAE